MALELEDQVGTMLPCNVIVQDLSGGDVGGAAVDPVASMAEFENNTLRAPASKVREISRALSSVFDSPTPDGSKPMQDCGSAHDAGSDQGCQRWEYGRVAPSSHAINHRIAEKS